MPEAKSRAPKRAGRAARGGGDLTPRAKRGTTKKKDATPEEPVTAPADQGSHGEADDHGVHSTDGGSETVPLDVVAGTQADLDENADTPRLTWVPLNAIRESDYQMRTGELPNIPELAQQIGQDRLISYPQVRRTADQGVYMIVFGHRRIAALGELAKDLIASNRAHPDLRLSPTGNVEDTLVPVYVVSDLNDVEACSRGVSENSSHADPTPWEYALGVGRDLELHEQAGTKPTVRHLAARLGRNHDWAAQMGRIARNVSVPVLRAAGLLSGDVDDRKLADPAMNALSAAALDRVAKLAPKGVAAQAELLLHELDQAGLRPVLRVEAAEIEESENPAEESVDSTSSDAEQQVDPTSFDPAQQVGQAAEAEATQPADDYYQVNIRRGISRLTPRQAARYATPMVGVLARLVAKAVADLPSETRGEMRAKLEGALAVLRDQDT